MNLSCFGNFSMGELGDVKNLTLNNIKSSFPLKFEKVDAGKCAIPGFIPPNLPTFALPPIPIFGGIPPFNLFCLLPPFPGIPALTLPPISVAIPPLPFLAPIPLPIPGFALPLLPLLPSFDLGSLDFLCGLIKIDLPVLDPFADLNKLLSKLNALISAFNDFLNFCKENAEVINSTEVPPEAANSIAESPASTPPLASVPPTNNLLKPSGLLVPQPIKKQPSSLSNIKNSQPPPEINLENIKYSCDEPASNLGLYLANDGQIPADPALINTAANAIAKLNTAICDLTNDQVKNTLTQSGIPSPENYIGFKSSDIPESQSAKDLVGKLIENKKLSPDLKETAYEVMKNIPIPATSNFQIALALNSQGVPFGIPATNLKVISFEDVARAFYIKQTTAPLDSTKIVRVLTSAGVIDMNGDNISLALELLSTLPSPLDPYTIAAALRNVIAGIAVPSLKAMCIAASQGINVKTTPNIYKAKQLTLLESSKILNSSNFINYFANSTFKNFQRAFNEFDIDFPLSLYEIIPLLSIYFEVDDRVLEELFSSFDISGIFNSFDDLYNFLIFVAQTIKSQNTIAQAITDCDNVKQGDFVFTNLVSSVEIALKKYGISTPFDSSKNNTIANVLTLEIGLDYNKTIQIFELQPFSTTKELSFVILATGLYMNALKQKNNNLLYSNNSVLTGGLIGYLKNPIEIMIQSPTGVINDVITSTINIQLNSIQNLTTEIKYKTKDLVVNGNPTSGVAIDIIVDDIFQLIKIKINRISDFDTAFEAIENIKIQALYSTIASTANQQIPQHLINISF